MQKYLFLIGCILMMLLRIHFNVIILSVKVMQSEKDASQNSPTGVVIGLKMC